MRYVTRSPIVNCDYADRTEAVMRPAHLIYDFTVNRTAFLPATESLGRGIVIICIGLSLAAFSGALMKLLGDQISAVQVAWFRFAGMSLLLLPFLLGRYRLAVLRPARPWVQILRGLTLAAATTLFVHGAQSVDYADAIAILYAYPFLLVIVASLLLKESAGLSVWIGVAGGFAGVLLVMRPDFDEVNLGAFSIFACAAVISVQLALNRKLGQVSPPLITAFAGAAPPPTTPPASSTRDRSSSSPWPGPRTATRWPT